MFVPCLAASVVQSLISSVVKDNSGRVIMKAEGNVITPIKILSFAPSFNQSWDFNYEPMFNGVFSRDNLPRIKDGMYVMNLYDKQSKVTVLWFFWNEYISQEVLSKTKERSITHNIVRIQNDNSIMFVFSYNISL